MREMPVERITTVLSNVLYGIMVTNFFNGQPAPADVQAREILDIIFLGVLSEPERRRYSAEKGAEIGRAADRRRPEEGPRQRHRGTGFRADEPFGGANGS